jgi:hypothetical protein
VRREFLGEANHGLGAVDGEDLVVAEAADAPVVFHHLLDVLILSLRLSLPTLTNGVTGDGHIVVVFADPGLLAGRDGCHGERLPFEYVYLMS